MLAADFTVSTLKASPELKDQVEQLNRESWPEFMLHMNLEHKDAIVATFAEYQLLLCDQGDNLMAFSNTLPLIWNGDPNDLPSNLSTIAIRAIQDSDNRKELNALCAFSAIVADDYQGKGLSTQLLQEVKNLAADHGLSSLIVPVRPILKSRYPLTPMERYARWTRKDGAPFDPWIRVHWRMGAEILKVASNVRSVTGTVAEWEGWTGMRFPESGEYVVPGALDLVVIDRKVDAGYYRESNVWVKHTI